MINNRHHLRLLGSLLIGGLLSFMLVFLLAVGVSHAANINVSVGGNIQTAIDSANDGDVIRVQSGVYTENLVITKSITLEGGYNPGFTTRTPRTSVINGDGADRVINIYGEGLDVRVDGFEIMNGVTAGSGGGIQAGLQKGSSLVVHDNYIHDNQASSGGGISAAGNIGVNLYLTHNDLLTNTAFAGSGGGIAATTVMSGVLEAHDNYIFHNDASSTGGAYLQAVNYCRLNIEDNQVISNTSTGNDGGINIAMVNNSHGSFNRNQVRQNLAATGRGGGSFGIVNNGQIDFYDNQFGGLGPSDGNRTTGGNYGGVKIDLVTNSHLVGDNLLVAGNQAPSSGGLDVVVVDNSSIDLPGTQVLNNRAMTSSYGGLRMDLVTNSAANLENILLQANRAAGDAGGGSITVVTAPGAFNTLLMAGAQVISNTAQGGSAGGLYLTMSSAGAADLSGSLFERNRAAGQGGGLLTNLLGSSLKIDHTDFLSNTAGGDGGGLFVPIVLNPPIGSAGLQADHTTFINNRATAGQGGGAVIGTLQGLSAISFDDSEWRNNRAAGSGGALLGGSCMMGCNFSLSHSVLADNFAVGAGGAIYFGQAASQFSQAFFDDNHITGNSAMAGGALHFTSLADNFSTFSFNGNTVTGNQARTGPGGALLNPGSLASNNAKASLNGNTISDNKALFDGGGLFLASGSTNSQVELRDNIISSNVITGPAGSGGGVFFFGVNTASALWMTGNQINDNYAVLHGGGLFIPASIGGNSFLYFDDNVIEGNTALNGQGGGCFLSGFGPDLAASFQRNRINDNTARMQAGGCFIPNILNTNVKMNGNQFIHNTAGADAGALWINSLNFSQLDFNDNQVIDNQAGISGTETTGGNVGGLWLTSALMSPITMDDNTITGNYAYITGTTGGNFGALSMGVNGIQLKMRGNLISENVAEDSFGGLYLLLPGPTQAILSDNTIRANQAVTESGGLYMQVDGITTYQLQRNQIISNTASEKAGLWINNMLPGPSPFGNSENNLVAGNSNGGIYLDEMDFYSRNDTIANNGPYGVHMTGTVTATVYLDNGIVWGNTASFSSAYPVSQTLAAEYSDVQGALLPGTGNLNVDPLFAGGYHLQAGSPAIDQVPAALAPATDLAGIPRPVPVGGDADMGAYEWFRAGVTLAPDLSSTELPGTVVSYTLTITNDGNLPDNFVLDMPTNPLSWTVSFSPPSLSLAAGASGTVEAVVEIPAAALGGEVNNMTARATSQADPVTLDIATLDITVANVAGVSLAPDLALYGVPTQGVKYVHTLTNNGNFTDTITLSGVSSQGWGVSAQPAVAIVPAGGSVAVTLTVSVPPNLAAGVVDVTTVTAASSASVGTTSDTATDTTTVAQLAAVAISPDNQGSGTEGSSVTYQHTVTNNGNGTDTINLSAVSAQGWTVALSQPSVTLAAGVSAAIQVTVTIPVGAGSTVDVTTVTAELGYSPGAKDTATDTTQPGGRLYLPVVNKN